MLDLLCVADGESLAGPLINLGAIGVCLVALAIWYIRKDSKYEERNDGRVLQEQNFRKEISELHEKSRQEASAMAEKYRLALEKFSQTLDSVLRMMSQKRQQP